MRCFSSHDYQVFSPSYCQFKGKEDVLSKGMNCALPIFRLLSVSSSQWLCQKVRFGTLRIAVSLFKNSTYSHLSLFSEHSYFNFYTSVKNRSVLRLKKKGWTWTTISFSYSIIAYKPLMSQWREFLHYKCWALLGMLTFENGKHCLCFTIITTAIFGHSLSLHFNWKISVISTTITLDQNAATCAALTCFHKTEESASYEL